MGKELFYIEYPLYKASPAILWNSIGTPLGLSEWFADGVTVCDKEYTFSWDGNDEVAILQDIKHSQFIRFQWEDDVDSDFYFELKIVKPQLSTDITLVVTDFSEPNDLEDSKMLWNKQIEMLRRKTGM